MFNQQTFAKIYLISVILLVSMVGAPDFALGIWLLVHLLSIYYFTLDKFFPFDHTMSIAISNSTCTKLISMGLIHSVLLFVVGIVSCYCAWKEVAVLLSIYMLVGSR